MKEIHIYPHHRPDRSIFKSRKSSSHQEKKKKKEGRKGRKQFYYNMHTGTPSPTLSPLPEYSTSWCGHSQLFSSGFLSILSSIVSTDILPGTLNSHTGLGLSPLYQGLHSFHTCQRHRKVNSKQRMKYLSNKDKIKY